MLSTLLTSVCEKKNRDRWSLDKLPARRPPTSPDNVICWHCQGHWSMRYGKTRQVDRLLGLKGISGCKKDRQSTINNIFSHTWKLTIIFCCELDMSKTLQLCYSVLELVIPISCTRSFRKKKSANFRKLWRACDAPSDDKVGLHMQRLDKLFGTSERHGSISFL